MCATGSVTSCRRRSASPICVVRAKYRFGGSPAWAGLGYAYASTRVTFDEPPGTPGLPDFQRESTVAGLTPSFTYDTRDNLFTPTRGTFAEAVVGIFDPALGGDDDFQRVLRPFISLRGAPIMRYQGEQVAQIEAELRWQFWKRFSLLGFFGVGAAWNGFERFQRTQTIPAGGGGFRYELARKYGIHAGIDVAVGPDNAAVYLQVGSAWARP